MRPRLDLYPGYDVLAKRDGPSWNAKTREVLEERLAIGPETRRFFDEVEWSTMTALAERIVPQPADRTDRVPVAALVDHKLATDTRDGYRNAELQLLCKAQGQPLSPLTPGEAKLAWDRNLMPKPQARAWDSSSP